ncbi:MAG: hypothetical protein ABIQ07_09570 [Ginsengibacter sp.]
MKSITFFFILLTLFPSCKKPVTDNSQVEAGWYRIEIKASSNLDCHVPDITFLTGVEEARQILGSSINNIYVAAGLPKVLYQPGTVLTVKFRKPEAADPLVCTAMGPAYKQVVITQQK